MRLLDVGCGWGGMVRHAAEQYGVKVLGVTLSREQATWAQEKIEGLGLDDLAEVRHCDYREVTETGFDAVSSIGLTEHIGVRNYPSYFGFLRTGCARRAGCSTTASPGRTTGTRRPGAFIDRYVFPDGELTGSGRIITEAQDAGLEVMHEENFRLHYARTLAGWCQQPRGQLGRLRRRGRRGNRAGVGPVHGRLAAGLRAQRDPAPPRARGEDGRRRVTTATRWRPTFPMDATYPA